MTYQEIQQILLKIKKYHLAKLFNKVDDLNTWLTRLNQKQVKNFLTIDLDKINKNKNFFERCLIDSNFLNSDYYVQDIELISKAKSECISRCLILVAIDEDSLAKNYHSEDMNLILNATSDTIAECLCAVARDESSLLRDYHKEDMILIFNSKSDAIAECLNLVARSKRSLSSVYHRDCMEQIANAKSDEEAINLGYIYLNKHPNSDSMSNKNKLNVEQEIIRSLIKLEEIENLEEEVELEEMKKILSN